MCEKTELFELPNVIDTDCSMRGERVLNVHDSNDTLCKRVEKSIGLEWMEKKTRGCKR